MVRFRGLNSKASLLIRKDEVDQLIEAWERERPDLDSGQLHIWSRISRLAMILDQVRAKAHQAHGLQPWEFDVLAALRRVGAPYRLTPSQLVAATHVTSGTMTNRIDRLVEVGYVERSANPEDGRGVLVALLPAGRQRVDAALGDLLAAEAELSSHLGEDARAELTRLLRQLLGTQHQQ